MKKRLLCGMAMLLLIAIGSSAFTGCENKGTSSDSTKNTNSSKTASQTDQASSEKTSQQNIDSSPPAVKVQNVASFKLQFPYNNNKRPLNEVIGATHAGGLYNFTSKPFIYEGAETLLNDLGTRAIKLWLTFQYAQSYAFNSNWSSINNLTELAKTDYYKNVFGMPFKTIALEIQELCLPDIKSGMSLSQAEKDAIFKEDYELAKYLLQTYKGKNKIFILQNWEGDNFLGRDASTTTVQNMVDVINIRQDAVDKAKKDIGTDGCYVFHAAEVNKISSDWSGTKLVDGALLKTHCDLYSYSNWETSSSSQQLTDNLNYLAKQTPDSKTFGSKNIILGEFGAAENVWGGDNIQLVITQAQAETALNWGVQYLFYWELYCNETNDTWNQTGRPKNDDLEGLWLIRPDGTKSLVWDYFQSLFKKGIWK
jgi:hypothetical protein